MNLMMIRLRLVCQLSFRNCEKVLRCLLVFCASCLYLRAASHHKQSHLPCCSVDYFYDDNAYMFGSGGDFEVGQGKRRE